MAKYLLIESRDPFDSKEVDNHYSLAAGLVAEKHDVTVFLVQNGVFAARRSAVSETLEKLAQGGVTVLADEFSLRERGISASRLAAGVQSSPLDIVVDQLADGHKTIWL